MHDSSDYSDSVLVPPKEFSGVKKNFKVLIANDEAMQLYLLKCLFELSHFTVECFPNGFDALNSVKALHKATKQGGIIPMYDLIVLDLNMPILDGFDSCISIRSLFD